MMRRTIYTCYSLLLATVLLPGTISCTSHCGTVDESRLSYIDTRVGTAPQCDPYSGVVWQGYGRIRANPPGGTRTQRNELLDCADAGHGGEMHSTLLLRRYSAARLS